jgi:hypothetical protein
MAMTAASVKIGTAKTITTMRVSMALLRIARILRAVSMGRRSAAPAMAHTMLALVLEVLKLA